MRRVAVLHVVSGAEPLHRLTQYRLEESNVLGNVLARPVPVLLQIELDALRWHEIIVTSVPQVALMNEHISAVVVSGDKAIPGLRFPSPYCSSSHDTYFHNLDDKMRERLAPNLSMPA